MSIGAVFTPDEWALRLISQTDVLQRWNSGQIVCDPTGGDGAFLRALMRLQLESSQKLTDEMLRRLHLIEIEPIFVSEFSEKCLSEFGIKIPTQNIHVKDIILDPPDICADILIGNPPWMNYAGLPTEYKNKYATFFKEYKLTQSGRELLLGGSRVDLAALILLRSFDKFLKKGGKALFIVPTSLFFGDGAHDGFRNYNVGGRPFKVKAVTELTRLRLFKDVSTSYAFVEFDLDESNSFPVEYKILQNDGGLTLLKARPFSGKNRMWSLQCESPPHEAVSSTLPERRQKLPLPRQGLNTCGCNSIFFFEERPDFLPSEFLYPLAGKELWKNELQPRRWVFLPYNSRKGRPLEWSEIKHFPGMEKYLSSQKEALCQRKGVLIRSLIERGIWWSFLGVGPYSFSPYKVLWESYGRKSFEPIIVSDYNGSIWQANQSLQAFMPADSIQEALEIKEILSDPRIEKWLSELNGQGKCNWAQPGKIKKILEKLQFEPSRKIGSQKQLGLFDP